ncbi:MAG: Ig-like domain-containing protein [Bacteroidales bacterium]|nr:Ig-like domain-containing protein [Bacteroidales bacterium]
MKKSFIYIAALTLIAACNKVESPVVSQESDIIIAQIEQETSTKTYMDAHNNIRWSEGDQVVAFMKSSLGLKYQVSEESVGKTSARFVKQATGNSDDLYGGTDWNHNVVYYPYSVTAEAEKSNNNYALNIVLPSEQTYASESFGNGSMAMVAVSEDNTLTFKNILGGMKLQLKGTQNVKSIKLEGKNNEKLSGAAIVIAYTDETKPAITMASGASKTITLNCGSGVQLNESTATEFIIALPPVLFSKGFTVTVTDTESKTYTVETDKANTVLRSSILNMPAFKLGNNPSEEEPGDDELIVPVATVSLSSTSLKLYDGDTYQLTATVKPKDATDKTVVWSSDMPSVATVDQSGLVTGISAGTANISASAGGKVAKCTVTVSSSVVATADYIDEYGVNHGKGTAIGMAIWAPVNCGYHATDFKYGKLYQWGRKYGQGYSGRLYNDNGLVDDTKGTYADSSVPTIEEGGVSAITGQHKNKSNVFFTSTSEYNNDWLYPQDSKLWNSGSESNPKKTEYDPCPEGWRVPTYAELDELNNNYSVWTTDSNNQSGRWFSGANTYTEAVPQVFFPAAGARSNNAVTYDRCASGYYWSSRPNSYYAYYLDFTSRGVYLHNYHYYRAYGYSVRCVQE